MKRVIISMMILGGFIFLGTNMAAAMDAEPEKTPVTQNEKPGYTDTNNDGVCDYYDGSQPGKGLGPGNGQGLGRANGKGLGKGQGLKDGSGNGQRRLDGSGTGRNRGNGRQLRDGSGGNCAPTK
jgi:hypothetical protein